ncbi:hypothetical protein [Pedobacter psychrodurus]|uniref:hypothetical protein n=1 Tax=Pedobacter psychrodurus TaxID=2530456 RepID=UPI00292EAD41|nr:hypothetical protein [Pedobacter psychrodurus]
MGFVEDFTYDFIKPFGKLIILVIFSIYTRIALCIYLAFSNPLSVEFKYLAVIIFCIPILRYTFHSVTKTDMPDGSNTFTLCIFPILYVFVIFHILHIYDFPLLFGLFILFLPLMVYYVFVISEHRYPDNRIHFLTTLCFYLLPFLLVINYAFDFSKPIVDRYYVIDKSEITNATYTTEEGGIGKDIDYYLHLVNADKDISPAKWIDVTQEVEDNRNYFYLNKFVTLKKKTYKIFDKKKVIDTIRIDSTHFRYYFLLQDEIAFNRYKVQSKVYNRLKTGNYVFREIQSGLLGINRITYK